MSIITSLTIGGVERKNLLLPRTLSFEDQLNARDTLTFALLDATGSARPQVGQAVSLTIDGTLVFAGSVDRLREELAARNAATTVRRYEVEAVDYNQLADRRLAANIYDDFTLKGIVQDLVTTYLSADGVTLDPAAPTGPVIDYFVANYDTVAKTLDQLSEMTGYFWVIGPDKVLRLIDQTTWTAPAALTATSGADLAETLTITRTREEYRNEQYLRGGLTETDTLQTERFAGDGQQRTFTLALPVSRTPTVQVNGVTKTVGIRGVDTGKDWYWQEGANEISQDFAGTVLTASDVLRVDYRGYFPLLVIHREDAFVAERQTVEGGSGIYQHLESDEDITNAQLARDRTAGLLRRFGAIQTILDFDSRVAGWRAGQLLTVDRPEHALNGLFLIASVRVEHLAGEEVRWRIRAVSGEAIQSWVAFFQRLAEARLISRRQQNEAKSQMIAVIRTASEGVSASETLAVVQPAESVWHVGDEIGLVEVAA